MDMPNRVQIVDVLRGLTMLYIVLIVHALFWLELLPVGIRSIVLFEMPVIFMLSGYSFYLSEHAKNQKKTYFTFIIARLSRILIPYYFYVLFAVLLYLSVTSYEVGSHYNLLEVMLAWFNPFTFGTGHSIGMLQWHLWFIPIFLIVTVLLPIASKIRVCQPQLWATVLLVTVADYLLAKVGYLNTNTILSVIFYLIWALFGYHLAYTKFKYSKQDYLKVIALCLILLIMVLVRRSDISTFDMNMNKFPPNYIFFLFSCLWVSIFLLAGIFLKEKNINLSYLYDKVWLKPFIQNGYSIYLWQGFGYTFAVYLGEKFDLPRVLIWIIAILVTIFAGTLAGPVEKIKIKK